MNDLIARIWTNDETLTSLDLSTRDDDISYFSNRKTTVANATVMTMMPNHHAAELLQAAACKNTRLSHLRLYSSHVDSIRGPGRFARHLDMIQHLQGLRDLQIHAYCVPPLAFPTRQLARVIHRKTNNDHQKQSSSSRRQHSSLQRLALHQVRMDPHDRNGQILLAQAFASLQQQEQSKDSSTSTLQDLEWDPFPFSAATLGTAALANDDAQQPHASAAADGGTLVVATIAKLPLKRLALTGCGGSKTTTASMRRLGLSSPAFAPMFRIREQTMNGHNHHRHQHHHLQSLQLSSWILDNADCKVLAQFLKQTIDLTELDLSGCIFYWTSNTSSEQKRHASAEDDSPMAILKSFETNASVQYLNLTDCQFHMVVSAVDIDTSTEIISSCANLATMEERVYTALTRAVESHNYTLSWVKTCPLLRHRAKQEWKNVVHAVGGNLNNNNTDDDCNQKRTSVMDVLDDLLILNRSAMLSTPGNIDGSTLPSCIRKSLTGLPGTTWCHIVQRTTKSPTALYTMLRGNADQLF